MASTASEEKCEGQLYPCRGTKSIDSHALRTVSDLCHHLCLPSNASPDKQGLELSQTRLDLKQRYNKLTHILYDEDHTPATPASYCYYEAGDRRSQANYYDIKIIPTILFDTSRFHDCNKRWLNLTNEGKAKLHRMLLTGYRLWQILIYNADEKRWVSRNDDDEENRFSLLAVYGTKTNSPDVISHLRSGLSEKDMEPFFDNYLLYSWTMALNVGMTNGLGRTAVYELLRRVTELLPLVNIKTLVNIFNVTSCLIGEELSISDTSTVSFCSPPTKRKKVDKEDKDAAAKKQDSDDPDKFPRSRKHYVDLKVVCRDERSEMSKFLIMVEIHSRGKNRDQASHKFLKEVIAALQGQTAIFGLFFSFDCAILYFAEKDIVTNTVHVNQNKYRFLHQSEIFVSDLLDVGSFQTLVMDIFTCLIYGIEKFET